MELQDLLKQLSIKVVGYKDVLGKTVDVVEDGTTFEENALKKVAALAELENDICIADDSGLEVECLNGEPGIYSARYGGEGLTDSQRCQFLLDNISEQTNRAGQFKCVIALKLPDQRAQVFTGVCKGTLTYSPKGDMGFGYDQYLFQKAIIKHLHS